MSEINHTAPQEADWVTIRCSPSEGEALETPNDDWICPITHDYFYSPAILPSGRRYEFDAIVRWCGEHGTDPLTRAHVRLDEPPVVDLQLRDRISRWRTAEVRRHRGEAEKMLSDEEGAGMTQQGLQQVREHLEAALQADPRNAELHQLLVHHLELHGTPTEVRQARQNADLAQADEVARQQITDNLAQWTRNLQRQHSWLTVAMRGVGAFVERQPRTAVRGAVIGLYAGSKLLPRAAPLAVPLLHAAAPALVVGGAVLAGCGLLSQVDRLVPGILNPQRQHTEGHDLQNRDANDDGDAVWCRIAERWEAEGPLGITLKQNGNAGCVVGQRSSECYSHLKGMLVGAVQGEDVRGMGQQELAQKIRDAPRPIDIEFMQRCY